ncbi:MAG: bck1-like resistance to osmotic shock [Chaenotheca gracillima]|nr:MAG: bck1-like resistance to osmotic shock [Chaenotheca gracillima]
MLEEMSRPGKETHDEEPPRYRREEKWSKDEWAENIMAQDAMQQSVVQLQRTYNDFQARADESDRRMLQAAQAEFSSYEGLAQHIRHLQSSDQAEAEAGSSVRRMKNEMKKGYSKFAETAFEYSKYFDVMTNVAPEYVALAWGAIKLLLVVQVNMTKLKHSVEMHLSSVAFQIGFIESIMEYVPTAPMVRAVTDVYANFSVFLKEAISYYNESRIKRIAKALGSPWEVRFQEPIDRISRSVFQIKDMAQVEQLSIGQRSLDASHGVAQRVSSMSLRQDNLIEVQSISFNSIENVKRMMVELQQYVGERFDKLDRGDEESPEESSRRGKPGGSEMYLQPGKKASTVEDVDEFLADHLDGEGFDRFCDTLFPGLRNLDDETLQHEAAMEQLPGMDSYRQKGLNLLRMERVISWIEADHSKILWVDGCGVLQRSEWNSSFVVPLMIDATSNYESIVILRHSFSRASSSTKSKSCTILVQAFITQLFKQHPKKFRSRSQSFTKDRLRNAKDDLEGLWAIFLECLERVDAHIVYLIVDGIDHLQSSTGRESPGDMEILLRELNNLAKNKDRLFKILVTAQLANMPKQVDPELSSTLALAQRTLSLSIVEDEWAMVQYKMSEIDEGKCKSVTFAQAWMLYRPKTTIYTIEDDEWRAYVIEECSGLEPTSNGGYMPLKLKCWFVTFNGKQFIKRHRHLEIPQFSISKPISSLKYVPAGYLPNEGEVRSKLIRRGRAFKARVERVNLMDYVGSVAGKDFSEEPARVMIDYDMGSKYGRVPQPSDVEEAHLAPSVGKDLKPLALLLCPPTVDVYFMQDNRWGSVRLDQLRDVEFDMEAWERLVIRDGKTTRNLIEAVVLSYGSQRQISIPHSNKGSVILLHGPPGVGKASSVGQHAPLFPEAIAEREHIPLLSVSGGYFSSSANEMSIKLRELFDYALRWKAVVLLNDADVFLEKRGPDDTDVAKERMTSIFAQEIKHFDGLLFLITSRLTSFDEEIHSAIQSTAVFNHLHKDSRALIWKGMLDEWLGSGHSKSELGELYERCESYEFNSGDLKPRQIRNCIRTAVAIARARHGSRDASALPEAYKVTPADLFSAIQSTQALTEYMRTVEAAKKQNTMNDQLRHNSINSMHRPAMFGPQR